ncbi:sugar ABC transporter permease [Actinobacteria bacterium YIM 96077]|uniref:Sugar ABC transporter permease n=1 Tax=Phytoactinopolyspora halophila TaxID=1981511 RepID=A0A329QAE9_9ACTN|nr:sugar ABC transporter permease [Phytoactinopolyspora halophila]AYY12909.1 sugar ABC transporter permease [Actinobacteria bacterium YIM 96077]RAW09294.1 sugar ABC transporter permease [Phytoactinopolyspora halophila]
MNLQASVAPPGQSTGTPRPRRARRPSWARLDMKISPYLYVAPFFILFAIFGLYPLGYTVWISMTDTSPLSVDTSFVGTENFVRLFGDTRFWNSVINTLGMFVVATIPQLLMALILANWLNRRLRAIGFFRMAIAIPIVTSTAVVALVFGMFFARDYGLANGVLELFGFDRIDWRSSTWSSWLAISSMVDWRWTGYNALIYLAAMQAIPRDMFEAAEIDGASRMRQFWQITVPLLKPTIIFTVIISTIYGLQLFTEPLMFTSGSGALSGGTTGQFQTITMYLVQVMRTYNQWGYAGAIALVLFLLIVIMSAINFLLIRRISSDR